MQSAQTQQEVKKQILTYLLVSSHLTFTDCGTFIDQTLSENQVQFKHSDQVLQDCIVWLQARQDKQTKQYAYSNEYLLVYISAQTFVSDFPSKKLAKRMA